MDWCPGDGPARCAYRQGRHSGFGINSDKGYSRLLYFGGITCEENRPTKSRLDLQVGLLPLLSVNNMEQAEIPFLAGVPGSPVSENPSEWRGR